MKKFLKIGFVALFGLFVNIQVFAQAVDAGFSNPSLSPLPTSYPGFLTFGFDINATLGDQPLSSDDLASDYAEISITVSKLDGTGIQPTGAGADLFNWTYNAATKTFTGRSKDVVLVEDVFYRITFTNVPTTEASTALQTGYSADFTPPGTLLNSDVDNDHVAQFTASPLPVKLISFTAAKENKSAILNWVTTEEVNSDRFEIQRSVSGKDWNTIGNVDSHHESVVVQKYSFVDESPVKGQNLYRLKMVDRDNTFAYSRIQSVSFEGIAAADLSVYPNPSTDKLFIRDNGTVKEVLINNLNGNAVYHAPASFSAGNGQIDLTGLPQGMYIVKVTRKNGLVSTSKVVVSK